MIEETTYLMVSGGPAEIYDSALKFATVLSVIREQSRYYAADPVGSIGADEYQKLYGSPTLIFANGVPIGPDDVGIIYEKVTVIYKV